MKNEVIQPSHCCLEIKTETCFIHQPRGSGYKRSTAHLWDAVVLCLVYTFLSTSKCQIVTDCIPAMIKRNPKMYAYGMQLLGMPRFFIEMCTESCSIEMHP